MRAAYILMSFALMTGAVCAQRDRSGPPGPQKVEPAKGDRIAWYGTMKEGLAEAKRLGKPVLLLSAAPHCGQVPGVW